jgi:hypothetical protein
VWSVILHFATLPRLPGSGAISITHGGVKFTPRLGATNMPSGTYWFCGFNIGLSASPSKDPSMSTTVRSTESRMVWVGPVIWLRSVTLTT